MIDAIALAVENAHHFIANFQGNSQFGAGGLRRAYIAGIDGHIRRVDQLFGRSRRARDALLDGKSDVLAGVPPNLRPDAKLPRLRIEQENGRHFASRNGRGRSPGFAATLRPDRTSRARPGRLHIRRQCQAFQGIRSLKAANTRFRKYPAFREKRLALESTPSSGGADQPVGYQAKPEVDHHAQVC